jgi:CRP-like cAMP-binding protein
VAESAIIEQYQGIKVSPRVRMAALLYASGAAKTKGHAARAAGITKEYFVNMSNLNGETRRIINEMQEMILDESVATSAILQKLSRRAIGKLADLMDSPVDAVAFRAAQDLADRGPETQKTQRFQVDALTISGQDVQAMCAAMVESARSEQKYANVATDGLVEVDTDQRIEHRQLHLLKGDARYGKIEAEAEASKTHPSDAPKGSR